MIDSLFAWQRIAVVVTARVDVSRAFFGAFFQGVSRLRDVTFSSERA
jgi:hypothetical protein